MAGNPKRRLEAAAALWAAAYSTESGRHSGPPLTDAMRQWPTSHGFQAGNGPDGNEFSTAVRQWQTPSVADTMGGHARRGGKRSGETLLKGQIQAWSTPTARDWKGQDIPGRNGSPSLPHQVMQMAGWYTSPEADLRLLRPSLNPFFVEALMGLPRGWTVCGALGTPSFPNKRPSPSECFASE